MHPQESETTLRSLISPVQLGKTDQVMGTIFKKQIVSYGTWLNPDWWWDGELTMELDEDFVDSLIENFNNKTFGKRVSVPLNHTGDVTRNTGEVIKLEKGEGGAWAYLDIRDPETVQKIEDGRIFDVSIGFDWDYVDQKSLKHFGPTLIHVALVTDPYLNDMDDFQKADKEELTRRFDAYAANVGFGTTEKSIIMMSKGKVEELKRMKFAKVTNDKDHEVEVTYTGADGKEVAQTVAAGAEIEVPTEAEESVKQQIAESTAPDEGGDGDGDGTDEGDGSGEGTEGEEGAGTGHGGEGDGSSTGTGEGTGAGEGAGTEGEEDKDKQLARVLAENAELKATQKYAALLAKGKITPAQKELFMAFSKAGSGATITLAKDVKSTDGKKVLFAKGTKASVATMLSAILEAGPKVIKFGEQGGKGESSVELTKEQEEKIKRAGFNLDTFKKQLAKGTITLEDIN